MLKSNIIFSFLLLELFILTGDIYSQSNYTLAVYYKHLTKKNEHYRTYYPLGFGSTISRNISDKLVVTAGLEYSRYQNDSNIRFTPSVYRTEQTYIESHYSFIAGLAYSFLERKVSIRGGGDIVFSFFRTSSELSRYFNSTGDLDFHTSYIGSEWDQGIKLKADVQYNLSENLGILIQPGFMHYFFSEAKESDFFCTSAGLTYRF